MSENNLTEIPPGFGSLPLTDINFAQNQLGSSNFAWLKQLTVQKSLKSINLSDNKVSFGWFSIEKLITSTTKKSFVKNNFFFPFQIRYFPVTLLKIPKLKIIKLGNNEIKRIPFAIRTLKNLRYVVITKAACKETASLNIPTNC